VDRLLRDARGERPLESIEKFLLANHIVFPESFKHLGFDGRACIGSRAFSPSTFSPSVSFSQKEEAPMEDDRGLFTLTWRVVTATLTPGDVPNLSPYFFARNIPR
jgi:hypothetical protein